MSWEWQQRCCLLLSAVSPPVLYKKEILYHKCLSPAWIALLPTYLKYQQKNWNSSNAWSTSIKVRSCIGWAQELENWRQQAWPFYQGSVSCIGIERAGLQAASRAGEVGAPPNQPRPSGSVSQRTSSMLCDCHMLDTGAHCCPCFSTLIPEPGRSLAVSLHLQISRGKAKLAVQPTALMVIRAVQKVQCEAWCKHAPLWSCTPVQVCASFFLLLAQARWRSMRDCDCDCCANHSVCSLVFVLCFFTAEGALPHLLDLP